MVHGILTLAIVEKFLKASINITLSSKQTNAVLARLYCPALSQTRHLPADDSIDAIFSVIFYLIFLHFHTDNYCHSYIQLIEFRPFSMSSMYLLWYDIIVDELAIEC